MFLACFKMPQEHSVGGFAFFDDHSSGFALFKLTKQPDIGLEQEHLSFPIWIGVFDFPHERIAVGYQSAHPQKLALPPLSLNLISIRKSVDAEPSGLACYPLSLVGVPILEGYGPLAMRKVILPLSLVHIA